MKRFRKKPVVIDAYRFANDSGPAPEWLTDAINDKRFVVTERGRGRAVALIETLEGQMRAQYGDWIIRGVKGEIYPCKPDIFDATYEPESPAQPVDETERLRSLSDRAAPAPWVVYSEPEVGLFASVFSGTVMQTGFAPVNLDDPANVEFIVEAVNFTRAALQHKGEVSRG